jgi:hypothetical protein
MQYTEKELSKLISDLETEFTAHLAKAEEFSAAQPTSLAKAEDEKPAEKESKDEKPADKEESKPEAKESKEEKPEDAPPAEAKEAKPEGEAAPAAPAPEAPVAPSVDEGASGYDAEDIAHMDQMYMSMSKAELLAHHDSCVRALDAIGAEHSHAEPPAAEPAAPAAPVAPEAPAEEAAEIEKCGDKMSKSEDTSAELELAKSEAAAHKAKADDLQKNLDAVQEFLTKLVKKVPQGKAITSLEQVTKSEGSSEVKELSKSEITSILSKKAADPKLSKNDRDAINAYYLNETNLNTISHLLK